jgi:hypothetical protein
MTIHVKHTDDWYNLHIINKDEAKKIGLEKCCISCNVNKFKQKRFEDLHLDFPYIEKEKFYQLFNELVKDGEIVFQEES